MKKVILVLSIFIFFTNTNFSQIIAPNFSFTDTEGNSYNLYDELDAGKTIVLDFFSVNCSSCQVGVPSLETIWQNSGATGTDVWVWGIESLWGTNSEIDSFLITYGGTYPCFATNAVDSVLTLYNITYTPQHFVVCSDHTMKPCSLTDIPAIISGCQSIATEDEIAFVRKAEILGISSYNEVSIDFYNDRASDISIEIYNLLGNKITQFSQFLPEGKKQIKFSKSKLKSGYFIIRLIQGNQLADVKRFGVY
ncbi:MAG: redoxin domain-containing protein [Bacteroidetes bacterium]|jgi:hypothetical protein|nr:redoxin domain-containing protein [Bacteroidota bacterium]MBT6684789.1 redoxin domain-containing protein [Bacteroidota bacterium]MBT7141765.1 redoxin domain-containing protein [Bacteroidota bacterium]MBT7490733.1 redoxin domain-containing protein [Bacteroidota bacterium]